MLSKLKQEQSNRLASVEPEKKCYQWNGRNGNEPRFYRRQFVAIPVNAAETNKIDSSAVLILPVAFCYRFSAQVGECTQNVG